MKSLESWMNAYGRDHQNPVNQMIHKVCVPLIMMSLLGLLWEIPTPDFFSSIPFLNWSTVFMLLCLGFYVSLSAVFASAMLLIALAMLTIIHHLSSNGDLLAISLSVFVLAWIGQFIGHKIEGQKPSFLEDLQFLLIGPLWVIKDLLPDIRKNSQSAN